MIVTCLNQAFYILRSLNGILILLLDPSICMKISTLSFEGIEHISTKLLFKDPSLIIAS